MTSNWRIVAAIMLAVAAWGVFHAVGAYQLNHDPRRALVVLGCVGGFLGFWGGMLLAARHRLGRQRRQP